MLAAGKSGCAVGAIRLAALLAAPCLFSLAAFAQQGNASGHQPAAGPDPVAAPATAQATESVPLVPPPPVTCGPAHLGQCVKDIARDQAGIWTSPLHVRSRDLAWLLPFGAATGVAIAYDASAHEALGTDRDRIRASNRITLAGTPVATLGESGALYVAGRLTGDDHLTETGLLGAEAVVDADLVAEALKLATNRERPDQGNGEGGFWPQGTRRFSLNGSFPSGHAISSWALARVVAAGYPSTPIKLGVYAFATAISIGRVTANRHFPSDVLVGGTFGYLIGGFVVRHHAAGRGESAMFVTPVFDARTHTVGLSVAVNPGELRSGGSRALLRGFLPGH